MDAQSIAHARQILSGTSLMEKKRLLADASSEYDAGYVLRHLLVDMQNNLVFSRWPVGQSLLNFCLFLQCIRECRTSARSLDISYIRMGDEGAQKLLGDSTWPELRILNLEGTAVTEDTFSCFSPEKFPRLEYISFKGCNIVGAQLLEGLQHLKTLSSLQMANLVMNPIPNQPEIGLGSDNREGLQDFFVLEGTGVEHLGIRTTNGGNAMAQLKHFSEGIWVETASPHLTLVFSGYDNLTNQSQGFDGIIPLD